MKKKVYCTQCKYEFEQVINTMNDLKLICPKCGKTCNNKKYIAPTKLEKKVNNIAYNVLKFYYNFYLIFSTLGLFLYFLKFNKLSIICTIIMITLYLIELIIGYTRNIFGLFGFIVSIIIGLFINNIYLCIMIMFFTSSIIRLIYRLIISNLFKKYG